MTSFFTEAWTSGIVGLVMKSVGVTGIFAGASGTADFTNDGIPDIVISMYEDVYPYGSTRTGPTPGRMLLLKGKGNGTFVDASHLLTQNGDHDACVRKLRVGDFNADGIPDFVTATSYEDGRAIPDPIAVTAQQTAYLSKSGKHLRTMLGLKTWGHSLAVGDWNNDKRDDIIVGGFVNHPGENFATAVFVQNRSGALVRRFLEGRGGLTEAIVDLDGNGVTELVDYWTDWSIPDVRPSGLRVTAVAGDGSLGAARFYPESFLRFESGIAWNGDPTEFKIRVDSKGVECIDDGLHDLKVGDVNGDGRDDVLGFRGGQKLLYIGGVLHSGGEAYTFPEIYHWQGADLKLLKTKFVGWISPRYGIFDYRLIDWNGDGHLDVFLPNPEEDDEFLHIFLNDGVGNFHRIPQVNLPRVTYDSAVADPIDANNDGIMDILIHLNVFNTAFTPRPPPISTNLFLGTKRFYTGPRFANPALRGAPGFNADYYLNAHPAVANVIRQGTYADALDHFLRVGRAKGWLAFAPHTTVHGSDGADTIRLREGNETAIGGPGRDVFYGRAGADTFRFERLTDSGKTPATRDVVMDFVSGTDKIDLSAIDANGAAAGSPHFRFLPARNARFPRVPGVLRWRQENPAATVNDKTILEADTNGDAVADFQIELRGLVPIKPRDLVLQ